MQKIIFVDAENIFVDAENPFFTSIAPHFPSHHHFSHPPAFPH
jgi:hypothetical protein